MAFRLLPSSTRALSQHVVSRSSPYVRTRLAALTVSQGVRTLSTSPARRNEDKVPSQNENSEYHPMFARTLRRLKIFSVSSLSLSTTMTPFMFLIDSSVPTYARVTLASTALMTSGVSTALISWIAKPYVLSLKTLPSPEEGGNEIVQFTTMNVILKTRITQIFDPDFLVETSRPFATWELAKEVQLPASSEVPAPGTEETVAQTLDRSGAVLGSWVVTWKEGGKGECRAVGNIIQHFSVHQELLPKPIGPKTS